MRTFLLLQAVFVALLLSACGGGDGEAGAGNQGAAASFARQLVGSWSTGCENDADLPVELRSGYLSQMSVLTYTGSGLIRLDWRVYNGVNCTGGVAGTIRSSGSYDVGAAVVDPSGVTAYEVDIIFDAITDGNGNALPVQPGSLPIELFDLQYIDGVNLYSGDASTGDALSRATRPTRIDFSSFAIKQ